jgi:uncharacterized protein YlxW (UPF0749 family)
VRYKGQIGELKLSGFVISIALCLAFALFAYSRLNFLTEPLPAVHVEQNDLLKKVSDLENQVANLKAQVASLEEQKKPPARSKSTK